MNGAPFSSCQTVFPRTTSSPQNSLIESSLDLTKLFSTSDRLPATMPSVEYHQDIVLTFSIVVYCASARTLNRGALTTVMPSTSTFDEDWSAMSMMPGWFLLLSWLPVSRNSPSMTPRPLMTTFDTGPLAMNAPCT